MRKGELYGLRWRDITPHNATIRIERSYRKTPKSGRARTVPLHPRLAALLSAWRPHCPHTDEALVFPFTTQSEQGSGMVPALPFLDGRNM